MTTIGNTSRPAYVYDAQTDTWVPIGVGPHTHDEYIDKTIITAKGDIIVGTASDTPVKLGVGAEGSVLIADPTSPTGVAWGEAGGSITVSETAPEGPGEGDLWFNSTNATTYIYYDGFWIEQSPAVAGPRGEPGIIVQTVEPAELDALWLDSDETGVEAIPPGGTTGQILTKATNSNYDAQWINPASYNYIINGGFDIWQRGATFTTPAANSYTADRTRINYNGTGSTRVYSRQNFTPGSFSSSGYEPEYFYRFAQTVAGSGGTFNNFYENIIEDSRTLSGQTVTISFWGKADASRTITPNFFRSYGTGGSTSETVVSASSVNLTTEWVRYSRTVTIPSVAGKTIGAGSFLALIFAASSNTTQTIDIWGVQLELGSIATPFKRNAPSIQAELAACQRYYFRTANSGPFANHATGWGYSNTGALFYLKNPVQLRTAPVSIEFGSLRVDDGVGSAAVTVLTLLPNLSTSITTALEATAGSSLVQYRPLGLSNNNNAAGFVAVSAEL